MKFFDPIVHSDARPDRDLANMAYFGVERVVTCANAPRSFETAEHLREYFDDLTENEPERLRKLGIMGHVAIGIQPGSVPTRAHYEIWRDLSEILRRPAVVALGELTITNGDESEWELVRRQVQALVDDGANKPVIFRLPAHRDTRARLGWIRTFAEVCSGCGLPYDQALIHNLDWLTIDEAEAAGFHLGVEVGPFGLSVPEATRVVLHHDAHMVVAASGLRLGARDVLALPKLAVALGEAQMDPHDIERVVYGNAMGLFVR